MNVLYALSICASLLFAEQAQLTSLTWLDHHKAQATITFPLQTGERLYKDFIHYTTSHPAATIEHALASSTPLMMYDTNFKDTMLSFTGTIDYTIDISCAEQCPPFALHVRYLTSASDSPVEQQFDITPQAPPAVTTEIPQKTHPQATEPAEKSVFTHILVLRDGVVFAVQQAKITVSSLVEHTQSLWMRLLAVFLLGLLMSLTPCIYPMIPITVGILQTGASNSLMRNFLLAGSYTVGMALTFASLGLLAATGSTQFGLLLGNPFFVMFLVIFLAYMAGTMLGMYELAIPRFLQPKQQSVRGGSYLSAFVFGVISGSVASPCLSPGLLLLLSIVATLGNVFLGFVLLFMFGLGLGVPLLLIGTFSNSMHVLPQAGLWMVEVKKIFGLMLISMCYYYLSNILPWSIVLLIISVSTAGIALFVLTTIQPYESKALKRYKYVLGILLFCISSLSGIKGLYALMNGEKEQAATLHNERWLTSYQEAHEHAQKTQKLLLLDFGATWCTACTEVSHKILHTPAFESTLDHVTAVYIDCTNPQALSCAPVQKQFSVIGYPTLLLIDPATDTVIQRWGAEVLDLGAEAFSKEIKQLTHAQ